jgi:ABC-type nitrate/sulfonate/bicarbonate transport system permease component
VLLLAVWSAGSAAGLIEPRLLSPPWTVVTTAGDLIADGRLQGHLASSAQRVALGLLFGTLAGLLLAVAAGLSRVISDCRSPVLPPPDGATRRPSPSASRARRGRRRA